MKLKIIIFVISTVLILTACNKIHDTECETMIKNNITNISILVCGDYNFTHSYNTKILKDITIPIENINTKELESLTDEKEENEYKLIIVSSDMIHTFMNSDELLDKFLILLDNGYDIFFILDGLDYEKDEALSNDIALYITGQDMDHSVDPQNSKNTLCSMHIEKYDNDSFILGTIEYCYKGFTKEQQDFQILKNALRQ